MIELTILMPCLNEALTIGKCIEKAQIFLNTSGVDGEILVADNGSVDGSQGIALALGARVIDVAVLGYGAALRAGIEAARGKVIILGDADDSYDFSALDLFLERLRCGDDLVMGNRFRGGIQSGAMPWLHRWLGNPVLSYIGRLLFKTPIGDFHCGLRGGSRESLLALKLSAPGMEFASEMVVKASLAGMRISEVPTVLHKDGRDRPPHLRTWRDGWRHLRFLLTMSPAWLYFLPGCLMMLVGALLQALLVMGPVQIAGVGFGVHTLLYAAECSLLGWQLILFFILARSIARAQGILPPNLGLDKFLDSITLERGLIVGLCMLVAGLLLSFKALGLWIENSMGAVDPTSMMRITIPSASLALAGGELIFASFLMHLIRDNFRMSEK